MANNNKTPFLGLTTPASGDYNWGAEINNNFIKLDRVYGGLQSSMEELETTQRQDGFFNFIEGQEYIILNSMRVGKNAANASVLFPNTSPNASTYKGSEFFIVGIVEQSSDMKIIEFKPQACYCTTLSKNIFPNFTDGAQTGISFDGNYAILQAYFSPTNKYVEEDRRLESYRIKIDIGENSNLDPLERLKKLKKVLIGETIIPTYQLPNNTAFYVTVPARGYSNEETSTLYNKNAIYYERQLIIKYTDVGTVKFTSLNNTNGGVYVPQKELNSNNIHFTRRPITDTAQNVNAYVEPWLVYGEFFDVSGYNDAGEEGKWMPVIGDEGHYYTVLLNREGFDTSNKNLRGIQIDFFDLGSPMVDGSYKKVIVEYDVKYMDSGNNSPPELHVYGLTQTYIKRLLARTIYIRAKVLDGQDTTNLWNLMKKYVDEQIGIHVTGVINSDV